VLAFLEGPDLVIVLVIVAVLVGANRLPKLARSLGQAQHEFKKVMDENDAPEAAGASTAAPQRLPSGQLPPPQAATGVAPGPTAPPPQPPPPPPVAP